MGFCRRCGDIVAGERCKCGGTAVAPVVPFKIPNIEAGAQDKWSRTYISRAKSVSPVRPESTLTRTASVSTNPAPPSSLSRFPRPLSISNARSMPIHVTEHIASTSSHPPSPLKCTTTLPDVSADILPSLTPNDATLSKVYGSILQPKETLSTHSCAICAVTFPPDATIYPDPAQSSTAQSPHFLCKPCFTINGGSKGPCASCSRPVLTLKAEGGFIHAANKFWHKRCFNCSGCFKNISESPMVDLVGRPSCVDCFDSCLTRDTPKKGWRSNPNSPQVDKASNIGGLSKTPQRSRTRESSPAIDELEQRLGIIKKKEGSPVLGDSPRRLSKVGKDKGSSCSVGERDHNRSPSLIRNGPEPCLEGPVNPVQQYNSLQSHHRKRISASKPSSSHSPSTGSPTRCPAVASPSPSPETNKGMKLRLVKGPTLPTPRSSLVREAPKSAPANSLSDDIGSTHSPVIPLTPDLISDFSDATTQSSFEFDSPPRNDFSEDDIFTTKKGSSHVSGSRYSLQDLCNLDNTILEETNSQLNTPTRTPKSHLGDPTPNTTTPSKASSLPAALNSTIPHRLTLSDLQASGPSDRRVSTTSTESSASCCSLCNEKLFSVEMGTSYVMIPASDGDGALKMYHTQCFRCATCDGVFDNGGTGQAAYVKVNGRSCHPECALKERVGVRKSPSSSALKSSQSSFDKVISDSALPALSPFKSNSNIVATNTFNSPFTAPAATTSFPRFGSRTVCPGCKKFVSPMEHGVIPGPQGTRWHSSCLVCGGKKERPVSWSIDRGRDENKKGKPGCGKKLDSAAKTDGEGGVWCRECMLLFGHGSSPQSSPTRTTTIARQFTGMNGGESGLLRQLTGGGISPTRSLSPTKQLGISGVGVPRVRPRPKSVTGIRSTKSVDEGRGMFLVRQLTGVTLESGMN